MSSPRFFCAALLATLLLEGTRTALAFTASVTPGSPQLYLQVGVGSFSGSYNAGGTPANNLTVNKVSVSVPGTAVGTGTPQAMSSDSTAANSYWDGYKFCNPPAEVYVGGTYRSSASGAAAQANLRASVPATLTNGAGGTIPFSEISWTSSGNSESATTAQPFLAASFAPGTQTIGTITRNQWAESCHKFSYKNSAVVPAGTYTGRVVYTLSAP